MNMSSNSYNQHCNTHEVNSFRKAVASNNKQSIQKHLSHMKNISEAELNAALFTCIDNFRIEDQSDECLFLLLRNKANPNCEINGQTPLIAACKIAQLSMVKHLIENGARPDLCNGQGRHPLQFILMLRKENYDIAEYLISVIASVNIEIDKSHVLIVAVQKQFARIFKMLVDKGGTLIYGNYETILHIIMKKKFKDARKKRKFLKQLANRGHLSLMKDKFGKIPIEYETEEEIKIYYNQIFKQKQKLPQKDSHQHRIKEKDNIFKDSSKQKQNKKKIKQEEPSLTVEQQAIDQEENDQQVSIIANHEQDKEKIVQVIEEDQDQKKNDDEKQKIKKTTNKILAPIISMNAKKYVKPIIKVPIEKSFNGDKSQTIFQKNNERQKLKKNNNTDKKKKLQQTNLKKNRSVVNGKKISEIQQEKKQKQDQLPLSKRKQEEVKKKILTKTTLKDEEYKKSSKKQSEIKQQHKIEIKYSQESNKNKDIYVLSQDDHKQMQIILQEIIYQIQSYEQSIAKEKSSSLQIDETSEQSDKESQYYNLQQVLSQQIFDFFVEQKKKNEQKMPFVHEIIKYLQNKMKLCIQSHINHPFSFEIRIYGSQATGMAIEDSDIDIIIITNLVATDLMNMFEFYRIFEEQEIIDCKFIKNANIPVIKLALSQVFKSFKVDITFMFRQHRGLRCAELMNEFKLAEPLLQPLVLTLKRIIYAHKLSDPYTGGLSSYSITLMVIALLQMINIPKTKENIGRIFLQFLFFYGFQLDYVCQAIIIQPPYHAQHKTYDYEYFYNIYQLPNTMDLTLKLVIYDPLDPVNNVGRSTYRIQSLKNMLKLIYIRLKLENLAIADILTPQLQQLIQQAH